MITELDLGQYNNFRGIEREALRVTQGGQIATTMHPKSLGSKLVNDTITVDFSESLLELITKPHNSIDKALDELKSISAFCAQNIAKDEYLLNASMPVPAVESDINIAYFGTSNSGKMKEIYRRGLAVRYGKIMQAIAGVHYNFSFDTSLLNLLSTQTGLNQNQLYFSVINHYFEAMWLIPYLFGASPICAKSSVKEKPAYLQDFDAKHYVGEYATSLRMSDLGYQSPAQSDLYISYKDVSSYVHGLIQATDTPYQAFVDLGLYNVKGDLQQLNTSILQIENEYYSSIRPKQIAKRGQRPACALLQSGVRYLEVRLIDINPFTPLGVDKNTAAFIELMLMSALLKPVKVYHRDATLRYQNNLRQVIQFGRKPGLQLLDEDVRNITLKSYGYRLLDEMQKTALFMGKDYTNALEDAYKKLDNIDKTPSSQMIETSQSRGYLTSILDLSKKHHLEMLNHTLDQAEQTKFTKQVEASLKNQSILEHSDTCDIQSYIQAYYNSAGCDSK